ncbi:MAG TPA: hypothetical protein VGM04_05490 [Sphingomicrobium sp.]
MRNSTIFKSRWMALLWAAGIIWFAYDFAGSEPQDTNTSAENTTDATGAPVTTDDEKKFADALNSF